MSDEATKPDMHIKDLFNAMKDRCDTAIVVGLCDRGDDSTVSVGHNFPVEEDDNHCERMIELLLYAISVLQSLDTDEFEDMASDEGEYVDCDDHTVH